MKTLSEPGAFGLKSEKLNAYKTSGSIKVLLIEQFIRPLRVQKIGRAAIATSRILQIKQLSSKLKSTLYNRNIRAKNRIVAHTISN